MTKNNTMSSSEESIESRQRNEFEALNAIYGDDLRDLRTKAAWNKWQPLNLSISLIPQQGGSNPGGLNEINAKVDLHIICPSNYPNKSPKIQLENSKGLSDNSLVELQKNLECKAQELEGEEVIFQLCQYVQEFLHLHNKPSTKSFYDEMLQRRKEKEQRDLQAKQIEENRQRQFMLEEVQRRQEILKSELRLQKGGRYNSEASNDSDFNQRISVSNYSSDDLDDCQCENKTVLLEFCNRDIQRGQCLKHFSSNHTTYGGIDKKTGELLVISEWILQTKNDTELGFVLKQLSSIEQELSYLLKLKHPNLCNYLNINYQQYDNGKIIVYLLRDFINGINCRFLMNLSPNIQMIRYIAKEVLYSLDYLHRNNVIHRDLKANCIYINDKGSIKLTNYSIYKRLNDLLSLTTNNSSTYNRKTDIFKFGLFLLMLIKNGKEQEQQDCEMINIPNTIPHDLYDFLTKCLCKQEKQRYTTVQLLNHSFICTTTILQQSPKHYQNQHDDHHQDDLDLLEPECNNTSLEILKPTTIATTTTTTTTQALMMMNQSRITNEFEFLQYLGKGAFGDVIKVRNKLDGGYYAIKRIQLNPKNRQLNKKIIREVKLLSRLNHENVVRYYNSWIETTTIKHEENSKSAMKNSKTIPKINRKDEFTLSDNIEDLAPPIKNVEISVTYDSKSMRNLNLISDEDSSDEDDDDDDDDDDENWGIFNQDSLDSDGIEFERDDGISEQSSQQSLNKELLEEEDSSSTTTQIDFMYIQMEFCEKSTLRNAIDNNLYENQERVWRLFREIVEGLAHIHQQGMIHRDLKPVNIFLDYDDHVKIGDFGLATTIIKSKFNELNPIVVNNNKNNNNYDNLISDGESKTGLIGTALYVAPELSVATKAIYNQKVDIYSLGIIFFEMSYRPLTTNMERIKILQQLRTKDIQLPNDFINGQLNTKQYYLIKWLLNHDPSKRPTSNELLQSEYIPPPVLAECELRELVRHTLSNPQLKAYKYLIASCFNQSLTPAQDITYDVDPSTAIVSKPLQLYDFIKQITIKIFKQHGGQNLSTPLLMPKSKYYNGIESCVKLMTHFGGIVSLPHDLRVPFARYVAWNGITNLRRYSIERVYREKKVFGFLPRELYECAFDIVTPTPGGLITDAEILYLVYEIIKQLPVLEKKTFLIRLNHTSLIQAILLHFGIKEKHEEMYQLIFDVKNGRIPKSQMQTHLISFGLSDNSISTLTNILLSEYEISKAVSYLQLITKKRTGDAAKLAHQALQDLKTIIHNIELFGIVNFDIVISPGMTYNAHQYSGMLCQFVCELKKKHKHHGNMEVLAAGGRYDSMIIGYRKILEDSTTIDKNIKQSAVGISISLDKLVQAIQKEQNDDLQMKISKMNSIDVAVCSVGVVIKTQQLKEKIKILTNLWSIGIHSILIETNNLDEIYAQCNELKIPHLIMLKDSEKGMVIVSSWERDRFHEKNIKINELIDYMQKIVKRWRDGTQDSIQTSNSTLTKSESRSNNNNNIEHEPYVTVYFITIEKLSANTRKRYEIQIKSQLDGLFKKLTGYVVVLGLTIEANVLKTVATYIEFESERQYQKSLSTIIEKHPRHKKYLNDVCDTILEHKNQRNNPSVVLFSVIDSTYRLIV